MKTGNWIFLILAVLWMGVIFAQSAKVADVSGAESGGLIMFIGEHFVPGFSDWPKDQKQDFVEKYDHPVRKAAHMTEYAILAILLMGCDIGTVLLSCFLQKYDKRTVPAVTSWLVSTIYAATDEFHQTFVPGRSGELKDVCFDSAGALIGVFLAIILTNVIKSMFKDDLKKG